MSLCFAISERKKTGAVHQFPPDVHETWLNLFRTPALW